MTHWPLHMVFPSWLKRGPWPYEAGIAMLMLWLAECFRNWDDVPSRVVWPMWRHILGESAPDLLMFACWHAAIMLLVGLFLVVSGHGRKARYFRVVGLYGASTIFFAEATTFFMSYTYSHGGGAFALLAWRTLCVARRLGKEPAEDA